jgi:uncharacterized protein
MRPRSDSTDLVAALVALTLALAGCERIREWSAPEAAVVADAAGLLSSEQRAHMEQVHRLLGADHDLDYRVELVADVGDLDRYTHARFAELGVGSRSEAGRGLLLVLDATQDVVRVEVGRGLEGVLPDAFVAYLEHRQMLPYFRAGQVGDGVLAATELLVTRIQNAKARAGWDEEAWAAGSAGAGARIRAQIGRGRDESFAGGSDVFSRGSPAETVQAYLAAMAARNGNPDLDLYTIGTRAMLAGRVITPAQMDSVARAYRTCRRQSLRLAEDGTRAVVRYPVDARDCAPFLLVHEGDRWRLDFETAARAIRFGRSNAWHLVREQAGPYAFAFDDWRFDRHGYPHAKTDG